MRQEHNNPEQNVLSIPEEDLRKAIESSGYPFQSVAIDTILKAMSQYRSKSWTQEEWAYIDKDTGDVRTLDGLISVTLDSRKAQTEAGYPTDPRAQLRKHFDILVECKQSELPFIFFIRNSRLGEVPRLAGLPYDQIKIRDTPDQVGAVVMSVYDILQVSDLPFVSEDGIPAVSMTRVHRKGSKFDVSGEESFRSLALPLLKATDHYLEITKPKRRPAIYSDLRMVFPVAVLNAPMVGVFMENGTPEMIMAPFFRVFRAQPDDPNTPEHLQFNELSYFDVVHIGFLEDYIHLIIDSVHQWAHRIDEFAIPIIMGRALWPLSEQESKGQQTLPPWKELRPEIKGEQYDAWLQELWKSLRITTPQDEERAPETAPPTQPQQDGQD
jgi:hypothetical protein